MEDSLRIAFYEETDEMLQEIEECLLDMDGQGVTREKIDNLFRYMHTIKGSSAAMEIHDMAKLTHHLEDILGMAREQKLDLSRELINQMLLCLDELKIRIAKHKDDAIYEIDVEKYILALKAFKALNKQPIKKDVDVNGGEGKNRDGVIELLGLDDRVYKIRITLHKDSSLKGARLYIIADKLKRLGQIYKTGWEGIDVEKVEGEQFEMTLISNHLKKEIQDLIFTISDIEDVEIEDINFGAEKEFEGKKAEELHSVIRVNINKLDQLLRIVEELSVDKERLKQLTRRITQKYNNDEDIKALSGLVQQIDFIGNEMQESVMSTRMYTLDSVFRRFPRMIRDLSMSQGKEIQLNVEGENTELDRSIMEKIIDPLTHIIRNSVDHGIEKPEDRVRAGKEPRGTIKLSAGQEQGHIYIKIEDDGRGIDLQKLKESAIKRGLMSREQLDSLTEKETLDIIFMPGFSMALEVTNISGRGVGMNVVKDNIERINGIIDIDNREGQGLSITFKLPLTLAIIQSLLIKENKFRFALPLLSIIEIFKIKEVQYQKDIKFIGGKEVMNWRGEVLSVIRASGLFNANKAERPNSFIGIVLGFSTTKVILGVEEIIGQQQIVIKPLDSFIGNDNILGELKGISGTAILGDGGFAYVLDMHTLIKQITTKRGG